MKRILLLPALIGLSFLFQNCKNHPTLPTPSPVQLNASDIGASGLSLTIGFAGGGSYTINRDGQSVFQGSFEGSDTTVFDTNLTPGRTYTYVGYQMSNGMVAAASPTLQVKTMDTTSHNFIWQTFILGVGNSSVINDVAIINDTLIYAVGEIYLNDSTGRLDQIPYSVAVWNGSQWAIKRIMVNFRGNIITPPLDGVFCFSTTQIWLVGSLPIYGDGNNWTMYDLRTTLDPNVSVSKAWGSSPQDMYFVGLGGSVVHYSGSSWTKIASGTTTPIDDIFGRAGTGQNSAIVIAAVSDEYQAGDYRILSLQPTGVKDTLNWNLDRRVMSVWFKGHTVYECGSGVRKYNSGSWSDINLPNIFTHKIRGNDINDIFVCGALGMLAHYSGMTWQVYSQFQGLPNPDFISLDVRNSTVAAVGYSGDNALIVLGKRN